MNILSRNLYDNHASVGAHADAVYKKIVSECNNHFLIAFPRWIWRFIHGIFLSPIDFVSRKSKGRVVVNPSTHIIEDSDSGALNDLIDKSLPEDVPLTYYVSTQLRHWVHIWNLHIAHPRQNILLYKDDINSALHRVRYNPDIT